MLSHHSAAHFLEEWYAFLYFGLCREVYSSLQPYTSALVFSPAVPQQSTINMGPSQYPTQCKRDSGDGMKDPAMMHLDFLVGPNVVRTGKEKR